MNTKAEISILMSLIVGLYVAFVFTKNFCLIEPAYCNYGWAVFGAAVIGATFFLKKRWLGKQQ